MNTYKIFNKNKLHELTDGDTDLTFQIIKIFTETTPEVQENIQLYLKEEKWEDLKREIHKFQTQLRTFTSHEIVAKTAEIESIVTFGKGHEQLQTLIRFVVDCSNELIDELQFELQNRN